MRVAKIMRRPTSAEGPDRGDHAAMKLKVVVAIEQIMLAIVLVMDRDLHPSEPTAEIGPSVDPLAARNVRVAAPVNVRLGEVRVRLPVPLLKKRK